MFHRRWAGMTGLSLLVCAQCAGSAWAEITIQTVPVGNVGNAADAATGYGSVNYAYNIGKYEVTAGQYTAFLNAVAATDTYGLYNEQLANTGYGSGITRSGSSGSYTYTVESAFVNRPVNYVSFGDSLRFANWLHNGQPTGAQNAASTEDGAYFVNGATTSVALNAVARKASWKWAVTSEDEWYKAAYHKNDGVTGNYFLYPTSNDNWPGRDLADVSGNNANIRGTPYPIDSGIYTTVAGEFQNSESPYNTFDQGGNVWERNEAIISGSGRVLRGGSLADIDSFLQSWFRLSIDPMDRGINVGFRVSQVPEPASVGLLALGLTGMLMRRRDGGR